MRLSERLVWVVVVALGGFYIDSKEKEIKKLETSVAINTDFELKNLQRKVFYEMLLDDIDRSIEADEQYNELLDMLVENEN